MSEIRMNQKVWIINSKKVDGRYNRGKVIGLEKSYESLGCFTENQFLREFELTMCKVAYIDVFTKKGCQEWVSITDVSTDKPEDATN